MLLKGKIWILIRITTKKKNESTSIPSLSIEIECVIYPPTYNIYFPSKEQHRQENSSRNYTHRNKKKIDKISILASIHPPSQYPLTNFPILAPFLPSLKSPPPFPSCHTPFFFFLATIHHVFLPSSIFVLHLFIHPAWVPYKPYQGNLIRETRHTNDTTKRSRKKLCQFVERETQYGATTVPTFVEKNILEMQDTLK